MQIKSLVLAAIGAGLSYGAAAQERPAYYNDLTEEQATETDTFAMHNAMFTIFHESGHMLVSEFEIPVLGKEEDAVDALSSVMMLEAEDDDFDTAMMDAANGWFMSAQAGEEEGAEPAYWDEHGLDQQRAYSMVCMMLGKNLDKFKDFAKDVEYPDDRVEQCADEYETTKTNWFKLLAPNEVADQTKTKFIISYEKPANPDLLYFYQKVQDEQLLEMIEATYSGLYKLEDGIKLTAKQCDVANAWWSPGDREMTYCYEDIAFYAEKNAEWYKNNPDDGSADDASSEEDTSGDDAAADDSSSKSAAADAYKNQTGDGQ